MADGQLRIESMYAYIALDPADNTEGVAAFYDREKMTWMPLVGADMEMVESLRPIAKLLAQSHGSKISLIHFTNREHIEDIQP